MLTIRRAQDRGHFDFGWLDTYHSFSFADYYDPGHMGFRALRVINEDRIAPGRGFGTHPHQDMEIITYILEGALEHKDSMGNGSIIRPGEVQRMSAGTGVFHSEFNPSKEHEVHLLQIWLLPAEKGIRPSYEQKTLPPAGSNPLRLVASPGGAAGSVMLHQDACLYAAQLPEGAAAAHDLAPGRHAWVQVARGRVNVNGQDLEPGDGAALSGEHAVSFTALTATEVILFDLA